MQDGLAVGVVAVPERMEHATQIALATKAEVMVIDYNHVGERWGHQETLRRLVVEHPATWLLLIEDDAVLDEDFRVNAARALSQAPRDALVSFYLGTGGWAGMPAWERDARLPAMLAQGKATGWITADRLFTAVTFAVPLGLAPLLRHYLTNSDMPTDTAVGQWTAMMGVPVWYTYPPLVDHADGYSYVEHTEPIISRKALRA